MTWCSGWQIPDTECVRNGKISTAGGCLSDGRGKHQHMLIQGGDAGGCARAGLAHAQVWPLPVCVAVSVPVSRGGHVPSTTSRCSRDALPLTTSHKTLLRRLPLPQA